MKSKALQALAPHGAGLNEFRTPLRSAPTSTEVRHG